VTAALDATSPAGSRPDWRSAVHQFGSVVCVATADFNAPLWTNKQHLASRLATELPVLYVESLGLRHPRLTRRDVGRVMRRVRRIPSREPLVTEFDQLRVASPLVLPYHGHRAVRRLNRAFLDKQIGSRIERMPRPRLLWTYSPVVVDELDLGAFDTVVYHAVDDLGTVPGIPGEAIDRLERRLAGRADVVFTSAGSLATKLSQYNARTHLVGNAADIEHFKTALAIDREPDDVADMPRPRAIFAGALSDYKIDWDLLASAIRRLPDWGFVIVGPRGDETAMEGWKAVGGLQNCRLLGHRRYEELPAYFAAADVGLIPYRLSEHTAGVMPLKLVEYLAAGLSVVATPLDTFRGRHDLPLEIAGDPETFADAIRNSDRKTTARRERSACVGDRSWDALLDRMFARLADSAGAT
jgi:glycosyltransferase involved in cell wall biosynthesis